MKLPVAKAVSEVFVNANGSDVPQEYAIAACADPGVIAQMAETPSEPSQQRSSALTQITSSLRPITSPRSAALTQQLPLFVMSAEPFRRCVLESDIDTDSIPALAAEVQAEAEAAEARAAKRRAEEGGGGTAKKSKKQLAQEQNQRCQQHVGSVFIPAIKGKRTHWNYEVVKARLAPGVTLLTTRQEWLAQTKWPKDRMIKVKLQDGTPKSSSIHSFQTGNTRGVAATAEERAASNAQCSQTRKDRNLGQINWKESALVRGAKRLLDPNDAVLMEDVFDGLGPDFAFQERCTARPDLFAAAQGKTAEGNGTQVSLHIKAADGAPGGRYEKLFILGVIGIVLDPRPKRTMTEFDRLPEVQVTDIFLYANATQMPGTSLRPHPRTARNKDKDAYGDHRYTVGVDSLDRLEKMRREFLRLVREGSRYTKDDIWLCHGPGTLTPTINPKHTEEVLNCQVLARLVDLQNLRAPVRQNETIDVVWTAVERGRLSLKTATEDHGGGRDQWFFGKSIAPFSDLCHFVLVFYRDMDGNRTHMSVVPAARVYDTRAPDGTFVTENFHWSPTNNADVLQGRIDLRQSDALSRLRAAVSGV